MALGMTPRIGATSVTPGWDNASVDALDNPLWYALSGPQRGFAQGIDGCALRYDPEVSVFAALPDRPSPASWDALAALVGPGGTAALARIEPLELPTGWEKVWATMGLQMVADAVPAAEPAAPVVVLGAADVQAMLNLVGRAQPGPFLRRTNELGTYVGIKSEGELVAMAGQRVRIDGYVEISAVCTDAAHRGRGLGATVVRAVMAQIAPAVPILHVRKDNPSAISVYERLGFRLRTEMEFAEYRAPEAGQAAS
jgi:ribosomal protein S18 acetylase RimI-like enzyme